MLHIGDNGTLRLDSAFAIARKLNFMCELLGTYIASMYLGIKVPNNPFSWSNTKL